MSAVTDRSVAPSLFGHVSLGYLLAESQKLDEWRRFAHDGLGVHTEAPQRDVVALRIDEHARRIIVRHGPSEDVAALGWQFDSEPALQRALERLEAMRIAVHEGRGDESALRGVERFWGFDGPKRLRIELFTQPLRSSDALDMQASGFVTGARGMGHFAISTREPEAMVKFFQDVFDARISDYIDDRFNGIDLDLTFLRLNARHHSIAVAATKGRRMDPLRTRIHHLNLQCKSLDDVTQAYRRMREMGYVIANGIGQHPNDRELSFYVTSPSGFEIELGWNPLEVTDEASWKPVRYRGTSLWGHFPEGLTLSGKLAQMRRGLLSLTRKEYTVDGV